MKIKSILLFFPLIIVISATSGLFGSFMIHGWGLSQFTAFSSLTGINLTIFVFLGIIIMSKKLLKPLNLIHSGITNLNSSSGDLSSRIIIGSKDEIGALAGEINIFLEKFNTMITELKSIVETSTEIGENVENGTLRSVALGSEVSLKLQDNRDILKELTVVVNEASNGVNSVNTLISNSR